MCSKLSFWSVVRDCHASVFLIAIKSGVTSLASLVVGVLCVCWFACFNDRNVIASDLDLISIMQLPDASPHLWVHLFVAYFISFVVYDTLGELYELVRIAFASPNRTHRPSILPHNLHARWKMHLMSCVSLCLCIAVL
jgi:hypothetical protein